MRRVVAVATMLAGAFHEMSGQATQPHPYVEVRADAIAGNGTSSHAGVAATWPMGLYVRTSLGIAGGASWTDSETRPTGRVDVISRVTLDPFRERRWGVSLGGGLTFTSVPDARWRPRLLGVVDLEGPRKGRTAWSFQLGLGGGIRVGVGLRGAQPRWR